MWYVSRACLLVALILALALKIPNLGLGAPHVTIDDTTSYNGGFLVWFGNAPPQRMYLESWVSGVSSIAVYVGQLVQKGQLSALGPNIVADAYRDYFNHPAPYVKGYRFLMLVVDLTTAALIFALGRILVRRKESLWIPFVAAAMYLLSYNTIWCDVVARPDTLTAFFGLVGLLGYYRSDFGRKKQPFFLGAIAFGLCTGMKLHGAFFVVFILLDMIRQHGLRRGFSEALPFILVSVAVFAVAAGTPLFDPLKYVKLRMLNVADDKSPWLHWGDQVITALRGAGWLAPVLAIAAAVVFWKDRGKEGNDLGKSLVLMAVCWLLLFLSIRQLRAYWMLPALPLIYLAGLFALDRLLKRRLIMPLVVVLLGVLGWQSVDQARELRSVRYSELRTWVEENVDPADPFYIFGFSALDLPKDTACLARVREGLERGFAADLAAGTPHVERHLKNWEEQSSLALMDMLGFANEPGYEFYSYFGAPLDRFAGIIEIDEMQYLLVQEGFENPPDFPLQEYLAGYFEKVASGLTGNGGGGSGLQYQVFRRRAPNES